MEGQANQEHEKQQVSVISSHHKKHTLWTCSWDPWSLLEIDGILKTCAVYLVSEDILEEAQ